MGAQQQAEARLRSRLARLIRYDLVGQCTPVETAGTAGGGVPDVELCLPGGVQAWLELKVHDVARPDRPKKISHFRREQAKWLRDRRWLNGRAGLLIMGRLSAGRREYVMLDAERAGELWINQWHGRPWSWDRLRQASLQPASSALRTGWLRASIDLL